MKETTAYRSEFLVVECPYCQHNHYIDIADDMGEGQISAEGRRMTCPNCSKIMLVME